MNAAAGRGGHREDFVEVRMPADGAYVSVLRSTTAGLAARLDFTLDEIEDLRIAVDEACALLLADVVGEASLVCRYTLEPGRLSVAVTALTESGEIPARDTFAWTVLNALVGDVSATVDSDHYVTITLRACAETAEAAAATRRGT